MHVTGDGLTEPIELDERVTPTVETHVSTLWFCEDLVFKRKKAVQFAFVDLSTPELRERACRREVALNRRLAPDVYLGVAELREGSAAPVDHVVVMRRLPADRRLAALAVSGADLDVELSAVARALVALYTSPLSEPSVAGVGTAARVRARWEADLDELRAVGAGRVPPSTIDAVDGLAHAYVEGRAPLFAARLAAGHVVDGHGDLLADDIFCLPDGPRILDCLEFDDELRVGDALADVAFLAMDLERLGRPDLSDVLLARYRQLSRDRYPDSLAHHFVAARALVRSKVAVLRGAQADPRRREDAGALLALSRDHLEQALPTLVVIGGLPGTGKSTVAQGLADARCWVLLRTDEVRKDVAGVAHRHQPAAELDRGLYVPSLTARTYDELLGRARLALGMGESVVLDGSFADREQRRRAAEVASATSSRFAELRCVAPDPIARDRIVARASDGSDPSDASLEVSAAMAGRFDPWPGAAELDTADELERVGARALAWLDRVAPRPARACESRDVRP